MRGYGAPQQGARVTAEKKTRTAHVRTKSANSANSARERRPRTATAKFERASMQGTEHYHPLPGQERQKTGFQYVGRLSHRGLLFKSVNGDNSANGAWIRERQDTCNAEHASPPSSKEPQNITVGANLQPTDCGTQAQQSTHIMVILRARVEMVETGCSIDIVIGQHLCPHPVRTGSNWAPCSHLVGAQAQGWGWG